MRQALGRHREQGEVSIFMELTFSWGWELETVDKQVNKCMHCDKCWDGNKLCTER